MLLYTTETESFTNATVNLNCPGVGHFIMLLTSVNSLYVFFVLFFNIHNSYLSAFFPTITNIKQETFLKNKEKNILAI